MDLPQWKSHKVVGAVKITEIEHEAGGSAIIFYGNDADRGGIRVDSAYMHRHRPNVGGYYVRYEDGYESWSPAEAFEAGYTLLGDGDDVKTAGPAPDFRELSLEYASRLSKAADLRNEKQTLAFAGKILKYLEGEDFP